MKTTSPIVQRHYLHSVFTRPPVFDVIFRELSPASLIRTGRTCRVARDAVSNFRSRAFNINRHLSRFFSDPIAFRSLQARTGSLISGSSALQFLDRTFYPDSDLDIYVHSGPWALEVGQWLQSEGYTFIPNSLQSPEFNGSDWFRFEAERVAQETGREATEVDLFHIQHYRIRGVISVFSFEKQTGGHSDKAKLRVQIIVGKHSPLSAILCFHSTCVMNIIAFDAAYALYPHATFERRRSLIMADLTEKDAAALGKYAVRGWTLVSNLWPHETETSKVSFQLNELRKVCDRYSWTVPLDMTGVQPRPPLSPLSEEFDWDPVVFNSWRLSGDDTGVRPRFCVAHPTIFCYEYLVGDSEFLSKMLPFFTSQGTIEHMKANVLSLEDRKKSWTWWDATLAGFYKAYADMSNSTTEERMDE